MNVCPGRLGRESFLFFRASAIARGEGRKLRAATCLDGAAPAAGADEHRDAERQGNDQDQREIATTGSRKEWLEGLDVVDVREVGGGAA